MDLLYDVLLDSVKDTLQLVPFLFLTYLAMETLEHASNGIAERVIARAGAAGPAAGALLGVLPQCGFSAMAATLFSGGIVTVGTLVAVILSTSDELIPVFLAGGEGRRLLPLLAFKAMVGLVVGFATDAVLRLAHRTGDGRPHIHELCERAHCSCDDVGELAAHVHRHDHGGHDAHAHDRHASGVPGPWVLVVRSAVVHTAQVTLFIFLIGLAFGLLIEGVGEDAMATFLGIHPIRATFLAALVGLIPNCAASVAIAQLYLQGSLATGPLVAGLLVSGGVGLLVLYRTNRNVGQNLLITVFVYAVGVACGLVVGASGIVFA